MKIGLNLSADSISVLALNMGKIAVEVDGVDIAELIDAVNTQGLSLRIADEPGKVVKSAACGLPSDWGPLQHRPYHQRR